MKTWFTITNKASDPAATIDIFDEIGLWGVTVKDFAAALKEVPVDRAITLRINSPGGSIFDGTAIYNLIAERKDKVTARVIGLAASMASIIMLAAGKVHAAENATIMIHNPSGIAMGDSTTMREMADVLDKLRGQLVNTYAEKTGKPEAEIIAAMDATTWFTAQEAQDWGLVDVISSPVQAAASFDLTRFGDVPEKISGGASNAPTNNKPNNVPQMKNLLKALVEAKLIASADVSEDTAVAQFTANFGTIQSKVTDSETEIADLQKKVDAQEAQAKADLKARAESAIASAVSTGRLKDEAGLRAKWVEAYERDEEGAKAMLAALPEPKAPRGAAPVVTQSPANKPEVKTEELTGRRRAGAAWNAAFAAKKN